MVSLGYIVKTIIINNMLTHAAAKRLLKELITDKPSNRKILIKSSETAVKLFEHIVSLPKFKKQTECTHFIIKTAAGFGGRRFLGFHLVTANTGHHLLITQKSLKASPVSTKNNRAAVLAAMRFEIEPQILEFREEFKNNLAKACKAGHYDYARKLNTCPLSGKRLSSGRIAVDHIKPFIQIADEFLESVGLHEYKSIKLCRGKLASPWGKLWYDFHQKNCTLQVTGFKANGRASAKGYKSKYSS